MSEYDSLCCTLSSISYKERASSLNINYTKLSNGAIIGTAELYDIRYKTI